jgi:mono/diheme cytochrome c family protein
VRTDEEIVRQIRYGSGAMPPQMLPDQDIADVLAYLRKRFGGPPAPGASASALPSSAPSR